MKLIPRTSRPEDGNPYYNTKANGGYSSAIKGKVKKTGAPDTGCDVLANCVGYANGRFNEEANYGRIKYSLVCNAENFYARAQKLGLKVGKEPKLGGIMVWQKGSTLSGKDGAGHVEIVEYKYDNKHVKTSSSGYNSATWWMEERRIGDGNWREGCSWMGKDYTYLGCIYNPDIDDEPIKPAGVIDLTFELDGKLVSCWATVINGQNYIRLAELDDLGIVKSVSYDSNKRMPIVKT